VGREEEIKTRTSKGKESEKIQRNDQLKEEGERRKKPRKK
jgi:hypothetical protein